jgi:hypothetical protein
MSKPEQGAPESAHDSSSPLRSAGARDTLTAELAHESCHDPVCNGDRRFPVGAPGHCCSCADRMSRHYAALQAEKAAREAAEGRITALEAERDAWRRLFGLQTSGGWQTPDEAAKLHHETYQHGGKLLREAKARAERAEGRLQAIDNGNTFVFCDFVDERHRGCIRGAGHNGSHAVCLPPYPLGPVLLVESALRGSRASSDDRFPQSATPERPLQTLKSEQEGRCE